MKYALLLIGLLLGSRVYATEPGGEDAWKTGYKEPGGGFYFQSPDENYKFAIMGFAQAIQKAYISKSYSSATDAPWAFSIRRARLDFVSTFYKNYEGLIELDGAPGAASLAEARLTWKMCDYASIRVGKFVVPFSAENLRSARNLDTIERSMVLNTLFGIPALDAQAGVMILGKLFDGDLSWWAAVTNGNGRSTANVGEDNKFKEYQVKIAYKVMPDLILGAGVDQDIEFGKALALADLTTPTNPNGFLGGTLFNAFVVDGKRMGYTGDAAFTLGDLSLKSEYMTFKWADASGAPTLSGGHLLAGYFVSGNELKGFQPIMKGEMVKVGGTPVSLNAAGANQLTAFTVGYNWFLNSGARHQLNLIGTKANAVGGGPFSDTAMKFAILSEFQVRF